MLDQGSADLCEEFFSADHKTWKQHISAMNNSDMIEIINTLINF